MNFYFVSPNTSLVRNQRCGFNSYQPGRGALSEYTEDRSVESGGRAPSNYRTLTQKTPRALGVERVNGSFEGSLPPKRREESFWLFQRGQHPHFEETNLTVTVDSMPGAAGLKGWGDARGNMDIREGITISKHHRRRTQVNKYSYLLLFVFWVNSIAYFRSVLFSLHFNFHPWRRK